MARRCPNSAYPLGVAVLKGWKWIINERGYANIVEFDSGGKQEGSKNSEVASGSEYGESEIGSEGSDVEPAAETSPAEMPERTQHGFDSGSSGASTSDESDVSNALDDLTDSDTETASQSDTGDDEDEEADTLKADTDSDCSADFESPICVFGLIYKLTPDDEEVLDGYEGVPWAYGKEMHSVDMCSFDILTAWRDAGPEPRSTTAEAFLATGSHSESPPLESIEALMYVDRARTWPAVPKVEYVDRMVVAVKEAEEWGVPRDWLTDVVLKGIHVYTVQRWSR